MFYFSLQAKNLHVSDSCCYSWNKNDRVTVIKYLTHVNYPFLHESKSTLIMVDNQLVTVVWFWWVWIIKKERKMSTLESENIKVFLILEESQLFRCTYLTAWLLTAQFLWFTFIFCSHFTQFCYSQW